jgi:hypothetical protein
MPVPFEDHPPENIRGVIGWTVLFLTAGYVAFNAFYPNNDVNIAVDVLVGTFATMAVSYYIFAALKAVWTGSRANTDYLIVGIALSWISQDSLAWLRVVSRLSGFDPAFLNSEIFAPVKLLSVIAAVLHVIPKGAANGVVPRGNRSAVIVAFVVAVVLAGLILAIRPDPKPLIQMMPDWSRDIFRTGGAKSTVGAAPI